MPVDTLYLVMCGLERTVVDELGSDAAAVRVAIAHDAVHHCSPWVQYPLEHVHRGE